MKKANPLQMLRAAANQKAQQLAACKFSIYDKFLLACVTMVQVQAAHASSGGGGAFTLPGFANLGCTIMKWLTGELSMYIFFIIIIVTLLVGMFAKMDWAKILGVIVLFGLLKGVVTLFANSGFMSSVLPTNCIAT